MKTAVITGTSSGIGRAICNLLLDSGFKVYGISRNASEVNNPHLTWIQADLTDPDSFAHIANSIPETSIDVLVNNAGVCFEHPALEFSEEGFRQTFDVNFKAPVCLTQVLRSKLQNGMVINISSVSDRLVGEQYALYCSSKAALNAYFDVVALEEKNIKFVSILPSYVDTPLLRTLHKDNISFDWSAPLQPRDIAELTRQIICKERGLPTGSRVIAVNEQLKEDLEYKENLWGYNATTNELCELHQS